MEENTIVTGTEGTDAGAAVVEKKEYKLDDETMASRSAYIRQEFKKDRSRGDIAKELGVPYYIVYSATANMFNAAHPEGGESVGTNRGELISVTETSRVFVKDAAAYEGEEKIINVSRPAYMRELIKGGKTRGEIAKLLDCPYATVYAATKDETDSEGTKGGKVMVVDPADGVEKPRVDVIRSMYAAGKDKEGIRRDIANALHVDYAVVWAATKEKKEEVKAADTTPAADNAPADVVEGETVQNIPEEEVVDQEQ